MSKARLVITAVTAGKRPVSEVAQAYGIAPSWVIDGQPRIRDDLLVWYSVVRRGILKP